MARAGWIEYLSDAALQPASEADRERLKANTVQGVGTAVNAANSPTSLTLSSAETMKSVSDRLGLDMRSLRSLNPKLSQTAKLPAGTTFKLPPNLAPMARGPAANDTLETGPKAATAPRAEAAPRAELQKPSTVTDAREADPDAAASNQAAREFASNKKEQVKKLQGLLGIKPDGVFGPETLTKLQSFQSDHKITSGKIDADTMSALRGSARDRGIDPETGTPLQKTAKGPGKTAKAADVKEPLPVSKADNIDATTRAGYDKNFATFNPKDQEDRRSFSRLVAAARDTPIQNKYGDADKFTAEVRSVQKSAGLPETGKLDADTYAALRETRKARGDTAPGATPYDKQFEALGKLEAARAAGKVDPSVIANLALSYQALSRQETDGGENITRSSADALGLMQVTPSAATEYADRDPVRASYMHNTLGTGVRGGLGDPDSTWYKNHRGDMKPNAKGFSPNIVMGAVEFTDRAMSGQRLATQPGGIEQVRKLSTWITDPSSPAAVQEYAARAYNGGPHYNGGDQNNAFGRGVSDHMRRITFEGAAIRLDVAK